MATKIWVNIGSGNGLLAWQHQAITWINVDWSSVKSSDIHTGAISQEMPKPSLTKLHLKITYLKFYSNIPGANELNTTRVVIIINVIIIIQYVSYYLILLSTGESVDVEQGLAAASGRPYEDDTKLSKFLKDKYLSSQWHKKYWYGDKYWPFYAEFIG